MKKSPNDIYNEQVTNPDLFKEMENVAILILKDMASKDALDGKDTKHYPDTKRALDTLLDALKRKYQPEIVKELKNDPAR